MARAPDESGDNPETSIHINGFAYSKDSVEENEETKTGLCCRVDGSANNSKWASRSAAQLTRNLHQRFKPKSQPNVVFRKRQVDEFGIITITKYIDDQEIRSRERRRLSLRP
ncbi:hypothetical protein HID58_020364 [Brassica napus]|uniref:Uncharacterized protein n=1 Tax=Brassica napus TaxID=3708 RepID=A0ABQ7XEG8_BRANA|nr:hypothetical protein HID58_092898 [Brassica napus]KAH0855076.1 hypothetical protein HID58_020364 [Brassica napus]